MSFAFSGRVEYSGSLTGLLARPGQLLDRRYRTMIRDILRFRDVGVELLGRDVDAPLGAVLDEAGFGDGFRDDYIIPMAAAIWSASPAEILKYPAHSFLRFFQNHGLIRVTDRKPWRTVTGGSRSYVERIAADFPGRIRLSTPVCRVVRTPGGVTIDTPTGSELYDHVVLAVHSDQALGILGEDAAPQEHSVLAPLRYADNTAVLHSDPNLMPRRRSVWSSWNYMTDTDPEASEPPSVTYWMNRLQNIDERHPLFVSLNPIRDPEPELVRGVFHYAHPQFDTEAIAAQAAVPSIQGVRRTWFAGAWCGYGFHEDGLQSGLNVAAALGSSAPWHEDVVPMSSAPAVPVLSVP